MIAQPATRYSELSEAGLAERCAARDRAAIEYVVTSNNQRLFRAAWSVLKDASEAEEAVQAAYMSAFSAIGSFEGRSKLSTWLTRIALNEALARKRSGERRQQQLEGQGIAIMDKYREAMMQGSASEAPDAAVAREQIRTLLERAVSELPEIFRTVFVLREVEGLSGEETADILNLPVATVKTRLLRARRRLQDALAPEVATALSGTFPFAGNHCLSLTKRVLRALAL